MTPYRTWLHVYTICLSLCTFLLLFAGGMVTSTNSGLAVPDWPTTFGQNMFTFPPSMMKGGIFYEHGHRLFASAVGFLTIGLCLSLWLKDKRVWMKWAGTGALALVILQGVLGGITVLHKLPVAVSTAHACTAELFFALTVLLAFATSRPWLLARPSGFRFSTPGQTMASVFVCLTFLQILMGAVLRHSFAGLAIPTFPLAFGALVPPFWNFGIVMHFLHSRVGASLLVVLGLSLITRVLTSAHPRPVKAVAGLLGGALLLQCLLGMLTIWSGKAPVPTTFHLSGGALVFTSGLLLFLMIYRLGNRSTGNQALKGTMADLSPVSQIASGVSSTDSAPRRGQFRSLLELMKFRMVLNILLTTWAGFYLASTADFDWALLGHTLLGTGVLAMGAFALNQAMEKEYDKRMERTRGRPLPTERLGLGTAYVFGFLCLAAGTAHLWMRVNGLTALLGATTLILYAAVYTPMKRYSSLNTLVGAIPGALPPLMGWTAAQDSLGLGGLVLAAILFFWQMPHFLALAWMYKNDYAKGGFKMLSVTDPTGDALFRHAVIQTLILVLVSLFPYFFGLAGTWYLMSATLAGGYFLLAAVSLTRRRSREAARNLFFVSLAYLPVVLVVMAFDKTLHFV